MPLNLDAIFKNSWREILSSYIESEDFTRLMLQIQHEYKTKKVYPESTKIFRAFNMCKPENLQVVWLGLDPYINGEAVGLSMAVDKNCIKFPPTLRILEEEHNQDLGYDDMDLSFERYADRILYLNTALTVEAGKTGSHLELWKLFTQFVLKTINEGFYSVAFVLLGKEAQKIYSFDTVQHTVINLPHPAAEAYRPGAGFLGSKLFTQINNHSKTYYGDKIF